jgi:hypothetical protein
MMTTSTSPSSIALYTSKNAEENEKKAHYSLASASSANITASQPRSCHPNFI